MAMVGGYKERQDHENDEGIQSAAKFAAQEIGKKSSKDLKLAKIKSAESQVVAGMNYRLLLDLEGPEHGIESHHAVVYQPLGQGAPLQLTEHKPAN